MGLSSKIWSNRYLYNSDDEEKDKEFRYISEKQAYRMLNDFIDRTGDEKLGMQLFDDYTDERGIRLWSDVKSKLPDDFESSGDPQKDYRDLVYTYNEDGKVAGFNNDFKSNTDRQKLWQDLTKDNPQDLNYADIDNMKTPETRNFTYDPSTGRASKTLMQVAFPEQASNYDFFYDPKNDTAYCYGEVIKNFVQGEPEEDQKDKELLDYQEERANRNLLEKAKDFINEDILGKEDPNAPKGNENLPENVNQYLTDDQYEVFLNAATSQLKLSKDGIQLAAHDMQVIDKYMNDPEFKDLRKSISGLNWETKDKKAVIMKEAEAYPDLKEVLNRWYDISKSDKGISDSLVAGIDSDKSRTTLDPLEGVKWQLEDVRERYRKSMSVYEQFLGHEEQDRGFIKEFISGAKATFAKDKELLPFVGDLVKLDNSVQVMDLVDKIEAGENLNENDKALYQELQAGIINQYISRGTGYDVGAMVAEMPKYIIEFAMTAGLASGTKAAVKPALSKYIANKTAVSVGAYLAGAAVQTGGFGTAISANTAEYMLPEYSYVAGEEGDAVLTKIDEGDDFTKALAKAGLSQYMEVLSEDAGQWLDYGADKAAIKLGKEKFMKKAIISKYINKMGLNSENPNVIAKTLQAAHWDGVINEIFEEEINEVAQAKIEGRSYNAPWTERGLDRVWTETLGIGIFGMLSGGAAQATDQFGKLKKASDQGVPPLDLEIDKTPSDPKTNPYVQKYNQLTESKRFQELPEVDQMQALQSFADHLPPYNKEASMVLERLERSGVEPKEYVGNENALIMEKMVDKSSNDYNAEAEKISRMPAGEEQNNAMKELVNKIPENDPLRQLILNIAKLYGIEPGQVKQEGGEFNVAVETPQDIREEDVKMLLPSDNASEETKRAYQFYSPNIEEDLDFQQAYKQLDGDRQAWYKTISNDIDDKLGLKTTSLNAIGDWSDGAENTVYNVIENAPDYETVRYSAALKGAVGNQKAVVTFMESEDGPSSLYVAHFNSSNAEEIRKILDNAGLQFRTIIPQKGGTDVAVFDENSDLRDNIVKLSEQHGDIIREIEQFRGQGEFLGSWDTRAEGLKVYRETISSYNRQNKTRQSTSNTLRQDAAKVAPPKEIKPPEKIKSLDQDLVANNFFAPRNSDTVENLKNLTPPKSVEELTQRIEQLNKFGQINAILRRTGGVRKGALGQFTRLRPGAVQKKGGHRIAKEGEVNLKADYINSPQGYLNVLAHELGHALEFQITGTTNDKTREMFGEIDNETWDVIEGELKEVTIALEGEAAFKLKPGYYGKPTELFARFLQYWMINPDRIDTIAPTAVEHFEKMAITHPMINEYMQAVAGNIDKGAPDIKNWFGTADLKERYMKWLGKTPGEIAYNEYINHRAMQIRGRQVISELIEEKFKNIKDDPATLFRAAESIKVTRDGNPVFGTRDFVTAETETEANALLEAGYKYVRDIEENGIKKPMFAASRYTPEEAERIFNSLSPEGQQLIKDFTATRDQAKDEFNREYIKDLYKIESNIEGWVHHYFKEENITKMPGGGVKFKFKKAGAAKKRKGAIGYVEDLRAATEVAWLGLEGARIYNDFIQRQLARVSKPLAEGSSPDEGWVEVSGNLMSGIGTYKEKGKKMIIKENGQVFAAKDIKYQIPREMAEIYSLWKDGIQEGNKIVETLHSLNRYWKINLLAHPGTAGTNFFSGGILYAEKVMNEFYLELLTGSLDFQKTRANLLAPLKVLTPKGWEEAPDWIYGADMSNEYGRFMKHKSTLDKGIDDYGNKALKLFGSVERYWKKVIMTAEAVNDKELFNSLNKESLSPLTKEERELIGRLNDAIDTYALDYDNIPGWLREMNNGPAGLIKPFAIYPYKYSKHVAQLVGSVFDQSLPWQERTAKLLTLTTVMSVYLYAKHAGDDDRETPDATENTPARLSPRGRLYVGKSGDEEIFVRTSKYPFFNLADFGDNLVHGNFEDSRQILTDQIGSLSPGGTLLANLMGFKNEYDIYTPQENIIAEELATFVPGSRILSDVSRMLDPYKRKATSPSQAITGMIPVTSEDLQEKLHGEKRIEKIPLEGSIKRKPGDSTRRTTTDYVLKNYWQDILLSFMTGIYATRIDPKQAEAFQIREEKNAKKREK